MKKIIATCFSLSLSLLLCGQTQAVLQRQHSTLDFIGDISPNIGVENTNNFINANKDVLYVLEQYRRDGSLEDPELKKYLDKLHSYYRSKIFLPNLCLLDNEFHNICDPQVRLDKLGRRLGFKVYNDHVRVDVSYPSIRAWVEEKIKDIPLEDNANWENVCKKEKTEKLDLVDLKVILNKFKDCEFKNKNSPNEDRRFSALSEEEINDIINMCVADNENRLFFLKKLSPENKIKFKEKLRGVLANGTGFQRIMSLLIVSIVNADKKLAFVAGFTCIHIVHGETNCTHPFSPAMWLSFYNLTSDGIFHEASHLYHYMLGSSVVRNFTATNLAITQSNNLMHLFYPMLLFDTPSVQIVINAIKNELPIIRKSKNFKNAMKVVFITIMGQGFGGLLPINTLQDCTLDTLISYVENPSKIELADDFLAKVLYIYAIGYIWSTGEEMCTILGFHPFNIDNKVVIVEDRQNEMIESMRDIDKKDEARKNKGEEIEECDDLEIQKSAYRQHIYSPEKIKTNREIKILVNQALESLFDFVLGKITDSRFLMGNDIITPSKFAYTNNDADYEIKKDVTGITDIVDNAILTGSISWLAAFHYDFFNTDNPLLEECRESWKLYEVIEPQNREEEEFDVPMATILYWHLRVIDARRFPNYLKKDIIDAGKAAVYATFSSHYITKNKETGKLEQGLDFLRLIITDYNPEYLFDVLRSGNFITEKEDKDWENLIGGGILLIKESNDENLWKFISLIEFIISSKNSRLLKKTVYQILEIIEENCLPDEIPAYEKSLGRCCFTDKHWKVAEKYDYKVRTLMRQFSLIDVSFQIPLDVLKSLAPGKSGIGQNAYALYEDILKKLDSPGGIAGALKAFNESYLSYNGYSLLHAAASEVSPDNLRKILSFVEKMPKEDANKLLEAKDTDGNNTALDIATRFGRTEAQKLLTNALKN
ncbi:MAG: hypothetical protein LBJ71_05465 [Holosporaceae bacterium]|jgi:hypothetical protein|nr:hypothetical protein [Holosporaceae bacterium]